MQTGTTLERRTGGQRGAFTLVELLIVVVLIGIVALIAAPRLSQGASRSAAAATQADLFNVQKMIEMYAIEHAGVYPGAVSDGGNAAHTEAAFLRQMLQYTDIAGRASSAPTGNYRYGPYLRKGIPPLRFGRKRGLTGVHVVTGNTALTFQAAPTAGWLYNDTTGEFTANSSIVVNSLAADTIRGVVTRRVAGKDVDLMSIK